MPTLCVLVYVYNSTSLMCTHLHIRFAHTEMNNEHPLFVADKSEKVILVPDCCNLHSHTYTLSTKKKQNTGFGLISMHWLLIYLLCYQYL